MIVAADVHNLPWSNGFGLRHAPHWCVVDGRRDGRWHDRLAKVLVTGDWRQEERLRERWAFGDEEPELPPLRYQWFASAPSTKEAVRGDWVTGARAVELLTRR